MYVPGVSQVEVNQDINDAVDTYLKGQYFGTIIQLSDVLQIIHGVDGVDNVRWSSDIPGQADAARVWETDNLDPRPQCDGRAHHHRNSIHSCPSSHLYINGQPNYATVALPSYFKVRWNGITAAANLNTDSPTLLQISRRSGVYQRV
jgi:hypothetical protein